MKNLIYTVLCLFSFGLSMVANAIGHSKLQQAAPNDSSVIRLVGLVNDAALAVRTRGEKAFDDFRREGSRWRQGETYIFVLDPDGKMIVHNDPSLEGKNQLELKDVNGKPVIRGLLEVAASEKNSGGWYHYQWPVPGGLLPRWKSSYVKEVTAPSGKTYIVGCGNYDDRMESLFVIQIVDNACALVSKKGRGSFSMLRDKTGPYMAKDAYVFIIDTSGVELLNPGFPSLEGRNVMDVKDTKGKYLVRAMFELLEKQDSGWVEYMWPKPGESLSTLKSSYVRKATLDGRPVIVGCGVYLADAPVARPDVKKISANELMALVREAAAVLAQKGEAAFPEFRKTGSRWLHDETYFFVWDMDGKRVFHAANPGGEGQYMREIKDVLGRPWGRMFLEAAASPTGEGWVHYLYPEPGDIFPTWKSSFIKKVIFPDGKEYLVGCGIYQMKMEKPFIQDVVEHAVRLIESKGDDAFADFRDKTGPFIFLDTYIFVDSPEGVEIVNAAQPSVEGKNLIALKDAKGEPAMRNYLKVALEKGSGWVDYQWYRPGTNSPAPKHTYVKKAVHAGKTYVVGAGFYD